MVTLPPFQWSSQTPESISLSCDNIIKDTEDLCNSLSLLDRNNLSFDTLIYPLMAPPNYKTNYLVCQCKFLQHCSTDSKIREAAKNAGTKLAKARINQRMHKGVYNKVIEYKTYSKEYNELNDYQKYFVNSIIEDFERSGLALEKDKQDSLVSLLQQDADVCGEYSSNLGNETTRITFSLDELDGVNEKFIKSHLNNDNLVEITLKYPDISPILRNCNISSSREKIVKVRGSVYGNNLELLTKGIQYRKSIANLLGYSNYADYITSKRMVGNSQIVIDFLESLKDKVKLSAKDELQRLILLKEKHLQSQNKESDGIINAWDLSFYHELLMKNEYGVDDDKIREYFPVDIIVSETLKIYQELLSLRFEEITTEFDAWHKDVRLFCVYDVKSNNQIGSFYLDLHPRDGKYNHAAIFHLLKRTKDQIPVACMLTNLPNAIGDLPALLTHDDVITFFHEFGHIMHDICSEGNTNNTHLAKCPRDFVEAPSQMLENWCWQPDVLARLSKHYKTGESLPNEMLNKLIAAKNVNVSLFTLRQIFLSTLDITIHTNPPKTVSDIQSLVDTLKYDITLIKNPKDCNILRSFGHLMNQYAAGYYGYLWSEVLSADMFHTRFGKEGIFNPETGMSYRKTILAPGGIGSIMDHVKTFLGREPKQDHFLISRGIISK